MVYSPIHTSWLIKFALWIKTIPNILEIGKYTLLNNQNRGVLQPLIKVNPKLSPRTQGLLPITATGHTKVSAKDGADCTCQAIFRVPKAVWDVRPTMTHLNAAGALAAASPKRCATD